MNVMDYQEAEQIFQAIRSSKLHKFSKPLINTAIRYAQIRVEWYIANLEGKKELDEERTRAHNALISNCDVLAGNMKKAGEDDSWRIKLGTDRKRIGDFACLVHALIGIEAR
jgi:hypothetical protein